MLNDGLNARKFKEGIREIVVSDRHVDVPSGAGDVEAPSGAESFIQRIIGTFVCSERCVQ